MTRPLDPEAQAALDRLSDEGAPPLHSLSVQGARQLLVELSDTDPEPFANETVRDVRITGPDGHDLPVRVYLPQSGDDLPVLLYCHGGGWALGNLDSVDALCRLLAVEANVIVVSVGYRRSPEHPFPAALRDTYAALEWTIDSIEEPGGDPNRVGVGGDSAGGNLATAAALLSRDRGGPELSYQLLIYPALDNTFDSPSYEENADGYYLTREDMRWFWEMYLGNFVHAANPYAVPARHTDLSDLPPTFLLTCEFDPLRSEGKEYAHRLRDANVPVTYHHVEGMIHGFFRHVTRMESAREAAAAAASHLRSGL